MANQCEMSAASKAGTKGVLDWLRSLGGARCGAPAMYMSRWGRMCSPCADSFIERTVARTNIIGIARQWTPAELRAEMRVIS